jgi:hypothetical protein
LPGNRDGAIGAVQQYLYIGWGKVPYAKQVAVGEERQGRVCLGHLRGVLYGQQK